MAAPGDVIAERYVIESLVGRGDAAEVWQATDRVLGRQVAVKLAVSSDRGDAPSPEFVTAARSAAQISHPNVVAVYDTGREVAKDQAHDYVVMELCPGGSLASLLEAGSIGLQRAGEMGLAVARALCAAHDAGAIHGSLGPHQVLISDGGTFKVAGFTGIPAGSEEGERSDIYALGALLFHALVGRPPPEEGPPPLRSLQPNIPRKVESLVERCMGRDAASAYGSVAEVLVALERVFPGATAPTVARPSEHPAAIDAHSYGDLKWLRPVAAVIAIGAIAAIGLATALDDPGTTRRRREPAEPAVTLAVRSVRDFDPGGDGAEHPEDAGLAADGDAATTWATEQYRGALHQVKGCCKGVGLMFDLGRRASIGELRLVTATPGYEFEVRASDSPGSTEASFDLITTSTAEDRTAVQVTADPARFWLIWITVLPPESASATISEVTFVEA